MASMLYWTYYNYLIHSLIIGNNTLSFSPSLQCLTREALAHHLYSTKCHANSSCFGKVNSSASAAYDLYLIL